MNMKTLKVLVATFVVLLATHLNGQASPITIGLHVLESDTKDARKIEVTGAIYRKGMCISVRRCVHA